ncbi:MAG: IscS subfamily cysteine desulfurase [Pseudomonadales bacterium]|nr:IscS subfamily cysteine desulfurase [Pseudomonadales bacterium]
MKKAIYLDYAATTPVDPRVAEKMVACLTLDGNFGNAASRSHLYGWQAEEAVETARQQVADLIGADLREIVWTSGATESNNLAIKGVVEALKAAGNTGQHIITSAIEHKAVLDCCEYLHSQGYKITYLQPNAQGVISPEQVAEALSDETILVSLMHVNNELGTVTDIAAIGVLTRSAGISFHVDAAQSAGKLAIDCKAMNVDLLSLSAHKMYGPKGMGALFVNRQPKIDIAAQIHGGGHERGMRSGTLATHQIVAMGEAAVIAKAEMQDEITRISSLRDKLWLGIKDLPGISRNGSTDAVSPGHLNVCLSGVEGETLLMSLRELAISSGSACNSASMKPSYVLTAMGLSDAEADSSVRMTVGRFTDETDINNAVEHIRNVYGRLQQAG